MKGYPRSFLPALVETFAVLAVSGLLLVPTVLDLRFGFGVVWRLTGGQRLWVAMLHSFAALLMCAFAGALWSLHMRAGWRNRRHVVSGLATIGVLAGTALTALGVLYFGDERWLLSASALHTLLGAGAVIAGGTHWSVSIVERVRRRKPRRTRLREVHPRTGHRA